eukprot:Skav201359  [mRNA]  locus=scaffold2471:33817:35307:- [translate_table: standard]
MKGCKKWSRNLSRAPRINPPHKEVFQASIFIMGLLHVEMVGPSEQYARSSAFKAPADTSSNRFHPARLVQGSCRPIAAPIGWVRSGPEKIFAEIQSHMEGAHWYLAGVQLVACQCVAGEGAVAFFRWCNAVVTAEAVVVNMDECSLGFFVEGGKGTVLRGVKASTRASLSLRRSRCTYIASIALNPELNRKLPQILIGNRAQFTNTFLAFARRAVGARLILWKNQTAWNNSNFMVKYLQLVIEAWQATCPHRPLCVLFDCAQCHLTDEVYKLACAAGVRLLIVPAGATSILQPLDVYVFRRLRDDLRRRWTSVQSCASSGAVSKGEWVSLVANAVQTIVSQPCWTHAFEGTGVCGGQGKLSKRLLQTLQWAHCPAIPLGLPSLGQVCHLFPTRGHVDVDAWVHFTEPADLAARRFIPTVD